VCTHGALGVSPIQAHSETCFLAWMNGQPDSLIDRKYKDEDKKKMCTHHRPHFFRRDVKTSGPDRTARESTPCARDAPCAGSSKCSGQYYDKWTQIGTFVGTQTKVQVRGQHGDWVQTAMTWAEVYSSCPPKAQKRAPRTAFTANVSMFTCLGHGAVCSHLSCMASGEKQIHRALIAPSPLACKPRSMAGNMRSVQGSHGIKQTQTNMCSYHTADFQPRCQTCCPTDDDVSLPERLSKPDRGWRKLARACRRCFHPRLLRPTADI
jgi:hypothetical protein